MLARTHLVDDLRKYFLTTAAFAGNEHRNICRRNLISYVYGPVQQRRAADDAEALFDVLDIHVVGFKSQEPRTKSQDKNSSTRYS